MFSSSFIIKYLIIRIPRAFHKKSRFIYLLKIILFLSLPIICSSISYFLAETWVVTNFCRIYHVLKKALSSAIGYIIEEGKYGFSNVLKFYSKCT